MTKKKRVTRAISMLLTLILVAGCSLTAFAASQNAQNKPFEVRSKSVKKSYEIAVVYDNSGSMYGAGNSRWYQAKYAMEIFASMLNFSDGDKLVIFPMHKVTVGDNTRVDCIEVKSVADIDKVHNMYTPSAGGTPYSAVATAHTYLNTSQADVKWLVVLTDGAFSGVSNLQASLEQLAKGNIFVKYIPFGGTVLVDNDPNDNFYASPSVDGDDQLQAELISSCNQIFLRDELKERLNGQSLKLDLSMKKVIVFVQGNGATVTALKDSSGKEVKKLSDSKSRSYSEKGAGTTPTPIPEELKKRNGQVVMFDACPKGKYTLEHANADKIQIFYEPDITMRVKFLTDDGIMADLTGGKIEAGTYTYSVELVDSITGEGVTSRELSSGNIAVNNKVTCGDGREIDLQNGSRVTFDTSTAVNFDLEIKWLGKNNLSSNNQTPATTSDKTTQSKDSLSSELPIPLWVLVIVIIMLLSILSILTWMFLSIKIPPKNKHSDPKNTPSAPSSQVETSKKGHTDSKPHPSHKNNDEPPQAKRYAFISYSTKNQSYADAMRNLFNKHNIDTWMAPHDIPAGSKYATVITQAIRECSCFVLLLSNDSQKSEAVDREVELAALTYKKPLIPIALEKVELNDSFTFYIHNTQIIDAPKIDENSPRTKQIFEVVKVYTD